MHSVDCHCVATARAANAPGEDVAELRQELEKEGWKFVESHDAIWVQIKDEKCADKLEPLAMLYSLACGLCNRTKNERIGHLVRGSGASGGGAMPSKFNYGYVPLAAQPVEPPTLPAPASKAGAPAAMPTLPPPEKVQSIKHKLRSNSLDVPIAKAVKQAASLKTGAVYLKLRDLALSGESPFSGATEGDALCYTDDNNNPDKLTKNALGKRLKNHSL